MFSANPTFRHKVRIWVSLLVIASLCVVLEAIAFHLYARTHLLTPEPNAPLWIERYPGLRIEMDVFRPSGPREGDGLDPIVCDRFVGWPVPGLRTAVEYPIVGPYPADMRIHNRDYLIDWPTRVTVLPGIGVVWGKWALAIAVVWSARGITRHIFKQLFHLTGTCRKCGYDLSGLQRGLCPECGRETGTTLSVLQTKGAADVEPRS